MISERHLTCSRSSSFLAQASTQRVRICTSREPAFCSARATQSSFSAQRLRNHLFPVNLRRGVPDFDGVIVDSHPVHKRAWKRLLESVGVTASEEELQIVLDGRTRGDILRHFLGDLDPDRLFQYGQRKEQYFREEAAAVRAVAWFIDLVERTGRSTARRRRCQLGQRKPN